MRIEQKRFIGSRPVEMCRKPIIAWSLVRLPKERGKDLTIRYCNKLTMVLIALLPAASFAYAANVVVKPSDLKGWELATVSTGYATFTERAPVALVGLSIGKGAFYATCGAAGDSSSGVYPGQVWFGTNAYNGIRLDQITALSYYEWCTNSGIWNPNKAGLPDQWSPPRQPIGLRLIIDPQDSTPARMIYYRPRRTTAGYGYAPYPDDTDELNYWVYHDFFNANARFVEFIYNQGVYYGDWNWLKARFPNGKIVQPALQVGGQWPEANPVNTPNACGLSFQWGGEMYGLCDLPTVPWRNWWRESYNGITWMDHFTIGVSGSNTVYDFEADAPGRTVACAPNATQDLVTYWSRLAQSYVIYGQVVSPPGSEDFYVYDGRKTVRVRCLFGDSVIREGDFCRVYGIILPSYSLQPLGDPVPMRLHSYYTYIEKF